MPNNENEITRRFYSTAEVAAMLGVGKTAVYQMLRSGRLRSVEVAPRTQRISAEEWERFCSTLEEWDYEGTVAA